MENNDLNNETEEMLETQETNNQNVTNDNTNQESNPMLNTMTSDWKELSKSSNLKPKRRGLKVLIGILVFILILGGAGFAYFKFLKPDSQKVYSELLKEYSSSVTKALKTNLNRSTNSFSQEGNIEVKTDMQDYAILDGISLTYSLGMDINSNIINGSILYKEQDKNILDAKIYMQNNTIYLQSNQIYDKLIKIQDGSTDINSDSDISKQDIKDIEDLFEKGSIHLQKALTKADYKTEIGTLNINDKKSFVQKNIMIIDKTNINDIKNELINSIKNDSELLNIIKKLYQVQENELKTTLEELSKEDASVDFEPIKIEIDNNLITNKLLSFKIVSNNETVMNAVSSGKNTYDVSAGKDLKGTLTVNNSNNISFETKVEDYKVYIEIVTTDNNDSYNITLKVTDKNNKYITASIKSSITDKQIEKTALNNAVDISKLSEKEQEKIQKNIEKIYSSSKVFSAFMQDSIE